MFENKKLLKQIQLEKEKLQELKKEIINIQNILEDKSPKIDISNTFVFHIDGIYHFVNKEMIPIIGNTLTKKNANGYHIILRNIFGENIIYEKFSLQSIDRKEFIDNNNKFYFKDLYAYFFPIHELEHSLLTYVDNLVPTYVLQQLYYKVNGINLNAHILKKKNDVNSK